MNCCNHNDNHDNNTNNTNGRKNHRHMGHMWMMVLCCGAPVILLAVISLLGTSFPGIKNTLVSIVPFLCPVMMVAMMPMMFRRDKGDASGQGNGHRQDGTAENTQDKYLK